VAPRPRAARLRRRELPRRLADADGRGSPGAAPSATQVSWFAARAYCASLGKRLPTVDEWEYVAAASERHADAERRAFRSRLLALYAGVGKRTSPQLVRERYGVRAMHGVVWEWTLDFNSVVLDDDSRATGSGADARDRHLYCASPRSARRTLPTIPRSCARPFAPAWAHDPRPRPSASAVPRGGLVISRDARHGLMDPLIVLVALLALATIGCASQAAPATHTPARMNGRRGAERFSVYDLEGQWRDQSGATRALADWRGTPVLLAMIYTHCTATCPLAVSELKRIAALDPDVRFVLVSLDPARDDASRLADYAAERALDPVALDTAHRLRRTTCAISPPRSTCATGASRPKISRTPISSPSSTERGVSHDSRPDGWTMPRSPSCMRLAR
jgi:hypothetical protein